MFLYCFTILGFCELRCNITVFLYSLVNISFLFDVKDFVVMLTEISQQLVFYFKYSTVLFIHVFVFCLPVKH